MSAVSDSSPRPAGAEEDAPVQLALPGHELGPEAVRDGRVVLRLAGQRAADGARVG